MKLQTITIQHPDKPTRSAVLNIWFMPNGDIVLGGIGWYEKMDYEKKYEKIQKEKGGRKINEKSSNMHI